MQGNQVHFVRLQQTDSTNRYVRDQATDLPSMTIVVAEHQTAGRGQGSNRWESEEGKNLLFSILVRPTQVRADEQFVLSMAEALAVREAVCQFIGREEEVTLKWPNDLYWRDMKLSGTLIETVLDGKQVRQCIFGTGINVNQATFLSDAPNPVSLLNITGRAVDREQLLQQVAASFVRWYGLVEQGDFEQVHTCYHAALYRRHGYHPYEDAQGCFEARTVEVQGDGRLVLEDRGGQRRSYWFKEVSHLLPMRN